MSLTPRRSWHDIRLVRWLRAYMGYSRAEVQGMVLLLALGGLGGGWALSPSSPLFSRE